MLSNIFLIQYLVSPAYPTSEAALRIRPSETKIRLLYTFYQLNKNIGKGKWKSIRASKKSIAKWARVSERSVTSFINGEGALFFTKHTNRNPNSRFHDCNEYQLHDWVIKLFKFFEIKGMMKHFMDDFAKWRKTFLKRLKNWLIPLLEKGKSLGDIFVNKLSTMNKSSTKKPLTLPKEKGLKLPSIKLPIEEDEAYMKSEDTEVSASVEALKHIQEDLKTRFSMRDGDVEFFSRSYSLSLLKRAFKVASSWKDRGMVFLSPCRVFQTCISKVQSQCKVNC